MKKELLLYNSITLKKEIFVPLSKKEVSIYTCGPTVYNFVHIGNLRTFLVEDILIKTLNFIGYKTKHVMNFTDVDDKTIKRSIAEGKKLTELTTEYENSFLNDIDTLKFKRADYYPRATEYIKEMIDCIHILINKGYAYLADDGSVYYSIQKFQKYGNLSRIKQEDLIVGASDRIITDEYEKDNASDFVLWKLWKPEDGEVFWQSPWGKGRPGWHLECSVMSYELLGNTFDIHCGGIDNKFPHHENEIAQSLAAYGGKFSKYFMHIAHLKLSDNKMSKSLGNVIYLQNLINNGILPEVIRYSLLSAHYRQELNFTEETLAQSKESLDRIWNFLNSIKEETSISTSSLQKITVIINAMEEGFTNSLLDDLNIPKAMGFVFTAIREMNKFNTSLICSESRSLILNKFTTIDKVCGFLLIKNMNNFTLNEDQKKLLKSRAEARFAKQWTKADNIRDKLLLNNIEIKDTPEGQFYKNNNNMDSWIKYE